MIDREIVLETGIEHLYWLSKDNSIIQLEIKLSIFYNLTRRVDGGVLAC